MPELARFYGLIVSMFYYDHNPPHIHVSSGNRRRPDWAVQIAIRDGAILDGEAPDLAVRLLRDWIELHREELLAAWGRAASGRQPGKIEPMRVR